eukprot:4933430-Prymnesium_polylepis.1
MEVAVDSTVDVRIGETVVRALGRAALSVALTQLVRADDIGAAGPRDRRRRNRRALAGVEEVEAYAALVTGLAVGWAWRARILEAEDAAGERGERHDLYDCFEFHHSKGSWHTVLDTERSRSPAAPQPRSPAAPQPRSPSASAPS